MPDSRASATPGMLGPLEGGYALTPSDSVLDPMPRAIFVGTGGTLVIRGRTGATVTLKNVADGTLLPIRPTWILATSTAADIVALY